MTKNMKILCAISMLISGSPALAAATHVGRFPKEVHADRARPCILFSLEGVSVADPAVSSAPYFALHRNHPQFAELFAMLVTARASNLQLYVTTTGPAVPECGFASVDALGIYP